jgi:peptide chain release factor 2
MIVEKKKILQNIIRMQEQLQECASSVFFAKLEESKVELTNKTTQIDFFKDKKMSQQVYSRLKQVDLLIGECKSLLSSVGNCLDLCNMIEDSDTELLIEVDTDVSRLNQKVDSYLVKFLLRDEYDQNNAIVDINAGAGGQDAQDWVGILYRMYKAYCNKSGYVVKDLYVGDAEGVGFKSITFVVSGEFVYGFLKAEKGIHRLVRISPFDSNNRRHTSFASVEVSPEIINDTNISINTEDLRIDTYRSGGAGGQHVNKTDSAVRITHLPTGIVVSCQNERSQIQNKDTALSMLKSKLVERREREIIEKNREIKGELKKIEWGSQIRSYVFAPYTLVKDHRTNFESSDVHSVLDGNLHEFVLDYLKKSQREINNG